RECHPCKSRCMLVLAQDAAEMVAPADVELHELVRVGDRFGRWPDWSGVADALVRSDRAQGAGPAAALGSQSRGVAAREGGAGPFEDRGWGYQQPRARGGGPREPMQQCRQQRPIGWLEPDLLLAKGALQHRDLVSHRENLEVLVACAAGEQPKHRK